MFYLTPRPCRLRQTTVGSHQGRFYRFSQGHICRVVRRDVWMQLPYPHQKRSVTDSLQIKVSEVRERHGSSAFIEHPSEKCLPNNCDYLKVEQFRRHETFTLQTFTGAVAIGVIVREGRCNHRRVNDDQPASLSSRTASLAKRNDT